MGQRKGIKEKIKVKVGLPLKKKWGVEKEHKKQKILKSQM